MEPTSNRLEHFPVSFFAMVMGLAGLTIAWEKAPHSLGIPLAPDTILVTLTAVVFAVLLMAYLLVKTATVMLRKGICIPEG